MLFVGYVSPGSVPAVCDAPERTFDWKRIECIGIVLACPFFDVSMAWRRRIVDRFEQFVKAWDAAKILGRSISFATNVTRI